MFILSHPAMVFIRKSCNVAIVFCAFIYSAMLIGQDYFTPVQEAVQMAHALVPWLENALIVMVLGVFLGEFYLKISSKKAINLVVLPMIYLLTAAIVGVFLKGYFYLAPMMLTSAFLLLVSFILSVIFCQEQKLILTWAKKRLVNMSMAVM